MYHNLQISNKVKAEYYEQGYMIENENNADGLMDLEQLLYQIIQSGEDGKYYQVTPDGDNILLNEVDMGDYQMIGEQDNQMFYANNGLKQSSMMEDNFFTMNNQRYKLVKTPPELFIQKEDTIKYSCPEAGCSKAFNHANSLTKHCKDIHGQKVYVCRQCPQLFPQLSVLFLHARREHVDPKKPPKDPNKFKFHCNYDNCCYMTNNGGTFEHHIRAHTGEKPFECEICHKRFSQNANMKTHRSRHETSKLFHCQICSKEFKTHDIYLAHLRTREHELREHVEQNISLLLKIICLGCNEMFDSLFNVKVHAKNCVKELDVMYQCVSCNEFVSDFAELRNHVKTHRDNFNIVCPMCNKDGFQHYNQLNHHLTRSHSIKVTRKHVCRYCENTFSNEQEMSEHVRDMHADEVNSRKSHGTIGRMRCPVESCDFTANTDLLMRSHYNQHLNGKFDADNKSSPKKRGRKRKPLNPVDMDGVALLTDIDGPVVKRGRGRPRKYTGVDSPVDPEDGTQSDYENIVQDIFRNESSVNSSVKKRGRPRKTIDGSSLVKTESIAQAVDIAADQSENIINKSFTPYYKTENVVEDVVDSDYLYA